MIVRSHGETFDRAGDLVAIGGTQTNPGQGGCCGASSSLTLSTALHPGTEGTRNDREILVDERLKQPADRSSSSALGQVII